MRKASFFIFFILICFVALASAFVASANDVNASFNIENDAQKGNIAYPDAAPVRNGDDFASMIPDGKYYLSSDITVNQTYMNDFTGTFHGCGHTITVSVPLFDKFSGHADNFMLEGNIAVGMSADIGAVGAFADSAAVSADAVLSDIYNTADINSQAGISAGFIGEIRNGGSHTVVFDGCANDGNIESHGISGGIIGYSDTPLCINNCENNGNITVSGAALQYTLGGIAGKIEVGTGYTGKLQDISFDGCFNRGTIGTDTEKSAHTVSAGGIAGVISYDGHIRFGSCYNFAEIISSENSAGIIACAPFVSSSDVTEFEKCGNSGDIYSSSASGCTGGIGGCIHSDVSVKYCYNTANICGGNYASGLIGYINSSYSDFSYNYVAGNVKTAERKVVEVKGRITKTSTDVIYYFTDSSGRKNYFRIPTDGGISVRSDTNVSLQATKTPKCGQILKVNKNISIGETISANVFYTSAVSNKKYGICYGGKDVATVQSMDISAEPKFATVKLGDGTTDRAPVIDMKDIRPPTDKSTTYNVPLSAELPSYSTALCWSGKKAFYIDTGINFIAENTAGYDYVMGFAGQWSLIGGMPRGEKTRVPLADFESGKVADMLNTLAGQKVFYQQLNTESAQKFPVTYENKNGNIYSNGHAKYGNIDVSLEFVSVGMKGNVELNFYMKLSDEIAKDADTFMRFTIPNGNKNIDVNINEAQKKVADSTTYYVFACPMVAKEMSDTVKAQIFSGGKAGAVHSFSIREYCKRVLSDPNTDALTSEVIISMLNYGAASQILFGYNTGNLANDILREDQKVLPADVTITDIPYCEGKFVRSTKASAALNLESATGIICYFTIPDGVKISDLEFSYDCKGERKIMVPFYSRNRLCVKIPDIYAYELGNDYTVTIKNKANNETSLLKISALAYCNIVLNTDSTSKELKDVARAIWQYNKKALEYYMK